MPGAFHVEAVPGDDALLVYLLDMKFRNPKVTGSSVEVRLTRNAESWWLECRAVQAEKRFRCTLPTGANLATGELMVSASRGNLPEASAQYELPLMQGDSAGA